MLKKQKTLRRMASVHKIEDFLKKYERTKLFH